MRDAWFDEYAGGAFLPEPLERAVSTYVEGYADGVGRAAEQLREAEMRGWAEGFADACRATSDAAGPCQAPRAVRPRPLYGRGVR